MKIRMIKKVKISKEFNFKHYYNDKNEHIFSTEIVDGKEKRIDKELALKFEDLCKSDKEEKKFLIKKYEPIISHCASKIEKNNNIEDFKKQLDFEIKRISFNKLTINDFTEKQILRYLDFSRNNHNFEFGIKY